MTTAPGPSALRLIITLLISTLLLSCGGGNPAGEGNGAGIAFRLKWPVAKSVGLVPSAIPPGVVMIRMSVSGPDMKTMRADFIVSPTSPRTGSIENVPVGINRTITLQGLASNGDIIFQDVDANVTLKSLVSDPPYSHAFDMKLIATSSTQTAPSGLSATAISTGQVDLAWVNNANNESGYIIERKTEADANYTQIATVAANDTIYTDTTPAADTTYDYRVQAINEVTNPGDKVATATTTVVVPASTYSISGTITSSETALAGATITRYLNGSTTKTTGSAGNYSFDGTQNGSYTLTPAKAGYTFNPPNMAVTVDGADKSAVNFVATAVETIPAAPKGLSATAYASNLIYLAWVDNANNETGYIIERSTTGVDGSFAQIAPVPVAANVTVFTDTTVSAATTYYYRVRSTNGVGDSAVYSNEANAATLAPTYSISGTITSGVSALAGVTVTLTGSGSTAVTTNGSGNYSFSAAQNGDYTLTPGLTGYTFNPATVPVTVNGANLSALNFAATAIPTVPADPSGLSAVAVSSNLINLAWVDNASNETGYKIERKTGADGTYEQISTTAAKVTTYKDIVPSASTTYFYRVRASNGTLDSGYSAEASATTLVAGTLISPQLVQVGNFSIGKFEVTQGEWLAVMGNNPSLFPGCGPDCPVENVSWNDVQNFIATLNGMSGKNYRLPTEAEWQTAAQNGGFTYSGSNDANAVAWYFGNSGNKTNPVGQKQPNGLGIYDMSGNVWEWMNDWFTVNYSRAVRGGGWGAVPNVPNAVPTTYRYQGLPNFKGNMVGFRLAASP